MTILDCVQIDIPHPLSHFLWSDLRHLILFLSALDIVCCSLSSVGFYLGFILKSTLSTPPDLF